MGALSAVLNSLPFSVGFGRSRMKVRLWHLRGVWYGVEGRREETEAGGWVRW